jgi:hypothetical protein
MLSVGGTKVSKKRETEHENAGKSVNGYEISRLLNRSYP